VWAHPACTIAAALRGLDLVFEGETTRVIDGPTLERLAALYRAGGWPAEVEGDAFVAPYSAPSAGPPPWHLYRLRFHTALGLAGEEPNGATRWVRPLRSTNTGPGHRRLRAQWPTRRIPPHVGRCASHH
jgi:hypothetical protein